jgi:DNA-nicking Smr family endonuclease
MSRRRQLSDDEEALWDGFARSITPLGKSKKTAKPAAKPRPEKLIPLSVSGGVKSSAAKSSAAKPRPVLQPQPRPASAPPPLAPLGRRLKQRVARGREPIDARIDLHGRTQSEAHAALLHFLHRAQADGARTVLVVTGKGTSSRNATHDAGGGRGVLKRQVPLWLALPEFRPLIVGFDDAHVGHGGEGALYVRLRRPR